MKICDYTVKQLKDICDKYYNACSDCNKDCPFLKLGMEGCIRAAVSETVLIPIKILDRELDMPIKDTDKSKGMDADEAAKFFDKEMKKNTLKKDDERNVFGSRLDDVKEINRLRDENLELKLIIGDMQLKIFRLENKLKEKD